MNLFFLLKLRISMTPSKMLGNKNMSKQQRCKYKPEIQYFQFDNLG